MANQRDSRGRVPASGQRRGASQRVAPARGTTARGRTHTQPPVDTSRRQVTATSRDLSSGSARTTRSTQTPSARQSAAARDSRGMAASTGSQSPVRRRDMQVKGQSLRTTLMLSMVGMTAVTMIVLGLLLTTVSSSFLIGQAQHKGIELAKMAAQLGRAIQDGYDSSQHEQKVDQFFSQAVTWGDDRTGRYSDILGVTFGGGRLSGMNWGEEITPGGPNRVMEGINLPRLGWVRLPDDIVVSPTTRNNLPAFRFRVNLNERDGNGYVGASEVWLDLAADKVYSVRNRLFMIVGAAVVLSMGVVLFLAIFIAGKITRPLQVLVHDMDIVGKGNLDHQTRAHSKDEIGLLANSFNRMTRELKGAQSALVEQEKAEYELSIAREVQQQLLPAGTPDIPGYQPFAYYKGAKAVSGDYYDFIPLGNGLWGFIIADVSGKGIPGSMVMAVTRTIIRLTANKHRQNAAETLKETNRLIAKQIKRGMFVTAFYAVLDTNTGQLTYSSAGHNPMLIYRAQSKNYELAAPKGIAIGFNDGPIFDKNIQQFQSMLGVGDSIILYTDGFPEAMNERNEEYGDERFYELVGANGHLGAQGVVEAMVEAVTKHRGRAPQSDDLTVLTVSRLQ